MQTLTFTVPNTANNHILHGRIWTPSVPKAVIALVHGLGEHSGRYEHMAKAFASSGFATTAIDLHGHGKTRGPRGFAEDVDVLEDDIEALLQKTQQRFPGTPLYLMGHSMGGGLVLKYTLDRPSSGFKGIIAQAPLIKPAKPVPNIIQSALKIFQKIVPSFRIKSQFKGSDISTLAEQAKLYEDDPLNHGYLGLGLGISLFAMGDDIAQRAKQLTSPLLITHGTDDVLTSFQASELFSKLAPNAKFIAYENSAHEVHNDIHRDQVYRDIIAWVSKRL